MQKALIIIPTYNEASNIETLIPSIFERTAGNELNIDYGVLIIDDNSTDGTSKKAEELAASYPIWIINREKKMGLGTAYIRGFKWALERGYDYIYEMDADWSHNPDYLLGFISEMEASNSYCVIGSRFYEWRVSVINWHIKRLVLSLLGHRYARIILGHLNIYDTTSGYKCFRRAALEALNLDRICSNGYIFQLELNFRLFKKGMKITEIPVIFKDREGGCSKMSLNVILEGLYLPLKLKIMSLLKGERF